MIVKEIATVYRASTKGRRFLSRSGAINAETNAVIFARYPIEKWESETGNCYDIREDEPERYLTMYRRLKRVVIRSIRDEALGEGK